MTTSNSEIKTFIVCEDERVDSETSSKGNQVKFHKDNLWIKQDCLGYEGLVEAIDRVKAVLHRTLGQTS